MFFLSKILSQKYAVFCRYIFFEQLISQNPLLFEGFIKIRDHIFIHKNAARPVILLLVFKIQFNYLSILNVNISMYIYFALIKNVF